MEVSGGQLYAKSDADTGFTFVLSNPWTIPNKLIGIAFEQPWDAVCDIDFVRVYSSGIIISTGVKEKTGVPLQFALEQNYPNPFNPTTTISFDLPLRLLISLKVFDLLGKEVATIASGELEAGSYTRQWNATDIPNGVYFYRLQAGNFNETKKLILLK